MTKEEGLKAQEELDVRKIIREELAPYTQELDVRKIIDEELKFYTLWVSFSPVQKLVYGTFGMMLVALLVAVGTKALIP